MKRLLLFIFIIPICFLISCEYAELVDTSIFESEKELFTVEFDSNGGSSVDSVSVYDGSFVKRPKNPTKEGYEFDAWYTGDGEKWLFLSSPVTENITLFASYLPLYTVTFENPLGKDITIEVPYGKTASEPTLEVEGYMLEGWYKENGEKWNFKEDIVTNHTRVTAVLNKLITITYDFQIESLENKNVYILPNTQIENHIPAVADGAYFRAWYIHCSDNSYKPVPSDYVYTDDTTLIARWTQSPNALLLQFDAGDGRLSEELSRVSITKFDKIGELPIPFPPLNADFIGWYTNDGVRYSSNTVLTESTILKARYQYNDTCKENNGTDHIFSKWTCELSVPSCTEDVVLERACLACGKKEINIASDSKGHIFDTEWKYDGMSKYRECINCDSVYSIQLIDTTDAIGAIRVSGTIYGEKNTSCLTNKDWKEEDPSRVFAGKDGTPLTVFFDITNPTTVHQIHFFGNGSQTYTISVRYEGSYEYTLVGIGCFGIKGEFNIDASITAIKISMDNSGTGTEFWNEIMLISEKQ